jgi:hypothetical protein
MHVDASDMIIGVVVTAQTNFGLSYLISAGEGLIVGLIKSADC